MLAVHFVVGVATDSVSVFVFRRPEKQTPLDCEFAHILSIESLGNEKWNTQ